MRLIHFLNTNRIATRVWLVLSAIYLASAVLITDLLFRGFREDTIATTRLEMSHRLEQVQQIQLQNLKKVEQHAEVLAKAPEVSDLIEAFKSNSPDIDHISQNTEKLFAAFLSTYEEYFQLRLLDAETGHECIRLNKNQEKITAVKKKDLQSKGDRPYFLETIKLKEGEFYFSEFDLNEEHGQLSIPLIKTIRVATPIADSNGELRLVLVINVNAALWFDQMATYSQSRDSLYILDSKGEFIYHISDEKTFISIKPNEKNILTGYDKVLQSIISNNDQGLKQINISGKSYLLTTSSFFYGEFPPRKIHLILTIREDVLFAGGRNKMRNTLLWVLAALVVGLLLLMWLSRGIVRPIKKLDEQLSNFEPGGPLPSFNIERSDELGGLARTFTLLAGRVNQQIDQLDQARTSAEQSAADKEAFLGNFSHELRTPLNSIAGMTEVLIHKPHLPEQDSILDTLKYSVDNFSALINDVLDYNNILSGNLKLSMSTVVPEEIARNLCLAHELSAKTNKNVLSYSVAEKVPYAVLSDKIRLMQIINNLLSNALKFTEEGKVSLELDWNDSRLIILVRDTGAGMREEELHQIFERYHQSESGIKSKTGLGLGLAIVKHLVALFGGTIEVASELGKGSEFKVFIPAEKAKLDHFQKQSKLKIQVNDLSVLYVDDVSVNRITMEHLLDPAGVNLVAVSSCKEALEKLKNKKFDVILMDLRMPETDGFECIDCIRKELGDVSIIAVSANLGDTERNRLAAMGIHYTIEKPIDPRQLFATIISATGTNFQEIFHQIMDRYCNNDPELLKRIIKQLRALLQTSIKDIEDVGREFPDNKEPDVIRDVRHKLFPSIVMFGQEAMIKNIEKAENDPKTALKKSIAHMNKFLDQFEEDLLT